MGTKSSLNLTKLLLVCGILAPLIYIGSDIIAGISWDGYSFLSQAVSELRGIGAPTQAFLMPILTLYALLEIAFGIGILMIAGTKRPIRITGILFIALGILDFAARFLAMDASQEVSSVINVIHIIATILTIVFLLLVIVFGSFADGKWFRIYSFSTLVLLIAGSALTFMQVPAAEVNQSATWLGLSERIGIYGYMIWVAVLSAVLLKVKKHPHGIPRRI
jgi:hypothetical protein